MRDAATRASGRTREFRIISDTRNFAQTFDEDDEKALILSSVARQPARHRRLGTVVRVVRFGSDPSRRAISADLIVPRIKVDWYNKVEWTETYERGARLAIRDGKEAQIAPRHAGEA